MAAKLLLILCLISPAAAYEPQFVIDNSVIDQNFKNASAEVKTVTDDLDVVESSMAIAALLSSTQTFTGQNTFDRDNLVFTNDLHNSSSTVLAQYTTGQTTFINAVTGSTLTITTNGGRVMAGFSGAWQNSANDNSCYATIGTGGAGLAYGATIGITSYQSAAGGANYRQSLGFTYITPALAAGTYSFYMAIRASATNCIVANDAAVSNQFWVQELR